MSFYYLRGGLFQGSEDSEFIIGIGIYPDNRDDVMHGNGGNDILIGDHAVFFLETEYGTSRATAFNIDDELHWTVNDNPDLDPGAGPSTMIAGIGQNEYAFYAVTIGAGETITLDIDWGYGSWGGDQVDTVVRLLDGSNIVLAENDDNTSNSDGGGGSHTPETRDSYLTYTVATAGTYYIQVGQYASGGNIAPLAAGASFALNVSVTGHVYYIPAQADGDDILYGGDDDDILYGMGGDDILDGGADNDTLNGGQGEDTASYHSASSGVTIDLDLSGAQYTGGAGYDTLISIEHIRGSAYDDTLQGNGDQNTIEGGAGNDTIDGGTSSATYWYDIASYEHASSAVTVDLNITTAQDTLGAGIDTLTNMSGLRGSNYDDTLHGGADHDKIEGGDGNDTMTGGAGTDVLSYKHADAGIRLNFGRTTAQDTLGAGVDTISGFEWLEASLYDDTIASANTNGQFIFGIAGADTLISMGGTSNFLSGDSGDDFLGFSKENSPFSGAFSTGNVFDGGDGNDTFVFETYSSNYEVNLGAGTMNRVGLAGTNTLGHIENISAGSGDDILTGDGGANVIEGGEGDDIIDGGFGTDTASYSRATSGVTVSLSQSTAQDTIGAGVDTLSSIENLIGSSHDDILLGSSTLGAQINGGAGDDLILAMGTGLAVIHGAEGEDRIGFRSNDLPGFGGYSVQNYFFGGDGITAETEIDTFIFENLTSDYHIDLSQFEMFAIGETSKNTVFQFENVSAGNGNDIIIGDDKDNGLWGNGGADDISGGLGDDTIEGGAGADALDGGNDVDTLSYAGSSAGVTIQLDTGSASGGDAAGDTFSDFEKLIGSAHGDFLRSAATTLSIHAGEGGDYLITRYGPTSLFGEAGDDTLGFNSNTGPFNGSWSTGNIFDGGADTDTFVFELFYNDYFVDLLSYSMNRIGDTGTNTLLDIENISAGGGNDILYGDTSDNVIYGNDGDDIIRGNIGADTMDGGTGTDTLNYQDSSSGVTIDLVNNTASGGSATGDVISGFENVVGSSYDDVIRSNSDSTLIQGGYGDDTLISYFSLSNTLFEGNEGDDILGFGVTGGLAGIFSTPVTFDGGTDTDTLTFEIFNSDFTVDFLSGRMFLTSDPAFYVTLMRIENITAGGGDDVLIGKTGANEISGGAGDDIIQGNAGADILDGGADIDTLDYRDSTAGVTIDLHTHAASGGTAQGDVISNFENVIGSSYDDVIRGNFDTTLIQGGYGDDELINYFSLSDAVFEGNEGDDMIGFGLVGGLEGSFATPATFDGGADTDTLTFEVFANDFVVDLSDGKMYSAGSPSYFITLISMENIIAGSGDDVLTGDMFANNISGGAGADIIDGGAGNDILTGGLGTDTLTGGLGDDEFVMWFGDVDGDTITDFSAGDIISTNFVSFIGTDFFSGEAGEIRYEIIGGNTILSADIDGDATADESFTLVGEHGLVGSAGMIRKSAGDDFNHNGQTDLLFQLPALGNFYRLNDPTFGGAASNEGRPGSTSLGLTDFDGDGTLDHVMVAASGAHVVQYAAENTGSQNIGRGNSLVQGFADIDGDGEAEAFALSKNPNVDRLFLLDDQFGTITNLRISDQTLKGFGDFDGDGVTDALIENPQGAKRIYSDADGLVLFGKKNNDTVAIGDFDGDGDDDLLTTRGGGNPFYILEGDATSPFATETSIGFAFHTLVAAGDFDGDGAKDVLIRENATADWSILSSGLSLETSLGFSAFEFEAIGDFNGDGAADILWRVGTDRGRIFYSGASVGFGTVNDVLDHDVQDISDYDGDGFDDILISHRTTGAFSIVSGNTGVATALDSTLDGATVIGATGRQTLGLGGNYVAQNAMSSISVDPLETAFITPENDASADSFARHSAIISDYSGDEWQLR